MNVGRAFGYCIQYPFMELKTEFFLNFFKMMYIIRGTMYAYDIHTHKNIFIANSGTTTSAQTSVAPKRRSPPGKGW